MKAALMVLLFLFAVQISYSQSEKRINGKVVCEDYSVQGVEVVNLVSEETTITDVNGNFSILAKTDDMLVFVSKNYEYKRLFLDPELIKKNNFVISLVRKPEELDEVVVFKMPKIKLSKDKAYEQGKINELVLEKAARNPKPLGVYDGSLVNSPDLIRIGGMILSLFVKQKETTKKKTLVFKDIARSSFDDDLFGKTLQLKPEEIALFLEFCDADSKSKTILENVNVLSLMDFLFTKNTEFKKLASSLD